MDIMSLTGKLGLNVVNARKIFSTENSLVEKEAMTYETASYADEHQYTKVFR